MIKACLTCVPGVVAGSPGQIPGEAVGQKEDGPGQHNDVVDVEQSNDHLCGITYPWNKKYHICKRGAELVISRLLHSHASLVHFKYVRGVYC